MTKAESSNQKILYISRLPKDFDDKAGYEFFK